MPPRARGADRTPAHDRDIDRFGIDGRAAFALRPRAGMIALALAPALGAAVMTALALGLRSPAAFALAVYVLTTGLIVGEIELLSAGRHVTAAAILIVEGAAVVLAAAALVWRRGAVRLQMPPRLRWRAASPLVLILAIVVVAALAYELALAVGTPPNNWDSMTYHLSRAAAWYQRHGVGYIASHTARENANPPNAEILIIFTFIFAHSDRFASAWQWCAQVASLIAIFMIARRLGAKRPEALFAAGLFASLTQVAVQSVTTQNDLITASFVVAAVAFWTSAERHRIPLGAVAIGLAIGTKFTTVFAIPVLCAVALIMVTRRDWGRFALAVLGGIAALGAFGYVLNVIDTGSFLGAASATAGLHQGSFTGFATTVGSIVRSLVADRSGILTRAASEDRSTFGLLGAVVVVPVIVWTLVRWARGRASHLEAVLALGFPCYVVCLAAANAYNPFMGRFLITPAALLAPLFAAILRVRPYALLATVIAIVTVVPSLLFDQAKPSGFDGGTSIWQMSRPEAQSVMRPQMLAILETLPREVPPDARIGYVIGGDDWDYPLYGAHLTRHLVLLNPAFPFVEAVGLGLHWMLVDGDMIYTQPPAVWKVVATDAPDTLELLEHR